MARGGGKEWLWENIATQLAQVRAGGSQLTEEQLVMGAMEGLEDAFDDEEGGLRLQDWVQGWIAAWVDAGHLEERAPSPDARIPAWRVLDVAEPAGKAPKVGLFRKHRSGRY